MIKFNNICDYCINMTEMNNYALNYFSDDELKNIDIKVVLEDLEVIGVLYGYNNRYIYYKLSKEGYLPFYMDYQDNKIIMNKNEYYTLCKGNSFATIIDNNESKEIILSYINGYVKYNYHDLNNDKLYTFFYKQSYILNNNKNIIIGEYLNIPDGFCYQDSPKSIISNGYFKHDVSSSNPLAVLSESNNLLNFFDKYERFKRQGFPMLELYKKIKKNKDNNIESSIINFGYKNEDNYLKSLNELGISYSIPKSLLDFYNGSFEIENNLDEIINNYNSIKNDILKRKLS